MEPQKARKHMLPLKVEALDDSQIFHLVTMARFKLLTFGCRAIQLQSFDGSMALNSCKTDNAIVSPNSEASNSQDLFFDWELQEFCSSSEEMSCEQMAKFYFEVMLPSSQTR